MKLAHGPEIRGLGPDAATWRMLVELAEKNGIAVPSFTIPFLEYEDAELQYQDAHLAQRDSALVSRTAVNLRTRLTRTIWMEKGIVGSPMATVTGSKMAQELELIGCGAVLRRGFLEPMTRNERIEAQVRELRRTKRRAHFFKITDPAMLTADHTKAKGTALFDAERIGSIILVNNLVDRIFVNIITPRDLKGSHPLTTPLGEIVRDRLPHTAPPDISREEARRLLRDVYRVKQLPLVDAEGVCRGLITAQDLDLQDREGNKYAPHASWDKRRCNLLGIPSLGLRDRDFVDQAAALYPEHPDAWALEIAHGGLRVSWDAIRYLKRTYPDVDVIAPNISEPDIAEEHAKAGADAVRVGIGPGRVCTTRKNTGVGGSQLTAVLRCAEVAARYGIPLIADGGVRNGEDFAKALAAGASSVMIGTLFAGTEEAPGEEHRLEDGTLAKKHFGMASNEAKMLLRNLEQAGLLAKRTNLGTAPEGRDEVWIPYRGEVRHIVESLCGFLRSSMTYLGAATIADMPRRAVFEVTWDAVSGLRAKGARESRKRRA